MRKNYISSVLLCSMLLSVAACGDNRQSSDITTSKTPTESGNDSGVHDPLAGLDFKGETVNIFVAANDYDKQGTSAVMIIGTEEATGDVVQDAVYRRNQAVEEFLNINLEFTENHDNWNQISSTINSYIFSGDDLYDVMIHDLFPLATLSVNGNFLNVYDNPYMDFSQPYWYADYMKDVSFDSKQKCYIMAGDYFLDVLRSAHVMYVNQELYEAQNGLMDDLYQLVFDGKWTQDEFLKCMENAYRDINGNTEADDGDIFGYVTNMYWGPMIPWVIGADINYLTYDSDGAPSFDMLNDRSVKLLEKLNQIFWHEATINTKDTVRLNEYFINGIVMFSGYHRVRVLEQKI